MNDERTYPFLLVLFIGVVICAAMSLAHALIAAFMPVDLMCCSVIVLSARTTLWLMPVARGAALIVLVYVLSELTRRWWITRHFMAQLNAMKVDELPAHLTRLLDRSELARPPVVLATDTPLAFCFGLFRPRVCLSTGLANSLTDDELAAVLWHEEHHRRCFDPLRRLLADVLSAALFFLPIVADLRDWFLTSSELAADRYAMDRAGRRALARALHKLLAHPQAAYQRLPGVAGLTATSARLAQLLDGASPVLRFSPDRLAVTSLALMGMCLLAPGLFL